MAQLASITGNYPETEFDTLIPELTDVADIREAFLAYHFGVSNFDGSSDVPAQQSVHGHIESFKTLLQTIESNAVVTLSAIPTQISISASTGFVTIGLAPDVEITNNLTVENNLIVENDLNIQGNSVLDGTLSAESLIQAKKGINIYSSSSSRNSSIPSPVKGVIAYTSDNDQISIYSGSSWVGIENHGTLGGRIDSAEVLALLGL
jgi:hypothetical protein